MKTTYDLQAERYEQPYSEPDLNAPRSTGYVSSDVKSTEPTVTDLIRRLYETRDTITPEQIAAIEESLSGRSKS